MYSRSKKKLYAFVVSRQMAVTFVTGNKDKLAEVQAILSDVLPNLRSQNLDCKLLKIPRASQEIADIPISYFYF